jgi:hypothetical protein
VIVPTYMNQVATMPIEGEKIAVTLIQPSTSLAPGAADGRSPVGAARPWHGDERRVAVAQERAVRPAARRDPGIRRRVGRVLDAAALANVRRERR